jgi:phospholipid/cholesterol/gamma-HCH transport system substrate-binding protein
VTRLGLDEEDPSLVVARIRIAELTPVMRDTVAQLEPQGLTGLNYIQLNAGSPDAGELLTRAGAVPRISSRPAQLESLIESSEDIARNANMALARVNVLLSDQNLQHFAATLENVRLLSDELAGAGRPDNLAVRLRETLASVDQAAKTIDTLMRGDVATMVEQTTIASMGVNQAAVDAVGFMENINAPVTRFANDGLDDLTLALSDLRRVLAELEAIAAGVEDNPAAFVAGARREEVEIPR